MRMGELTRCLLLAFVGVLLYANTTTATSSSSSSGGEPSCVDFKGWLRISSAQTLSSAHTIQDIHTWEECQDECVQRSGCVGWNWRNARHLSAPNTCHLAAELSDEYVVDDQHASCPQRQCEECFEDSDDVFYVSSSSSSSSSSSAHTITFDQAEELCDAAGAELATCGSRHECNALRELCENSDSQWLVGCWIGLRSFGLDLDEGGGKVLSLDDTDLSTFFWTNGDAYDESIWSESGANEHEDRSRACAVVQPGLDGVHDRDCDDVTLSKAAKGALCRKKQAAFSSVICEHDSAVVACPSNLQLSIADATYGRTRASAGECDTPSTHDFSCAAASSLAVVRSECDGESACSVRASNSVFGDPCEGHVKYLEVKYDCGSCLQTHTNGNTDYHDNFNGVTFDVTVGTTAIKLQDFKAIFEAEASEKNVFVWLAKDQHGNPKSEADARNSVDWVFVGAARVTETGVFYSLGLSLNHLLPPGSVQGVWLDLQGSDNAIRTYAASDDVLAHDPFVTVRSGVGVTKQWKRFQEERQFTGFVCYTLAEEPKYPAATDMPTSLPTPLSTRSPTSIPTRVPTRLPTLTPTRVPTRHPTRSPTVLPTRTPSLAPTILPTRAPSPALTVLPTQTPTPAPTVLPTRAPTLAPTMMPTQTPTLSVIPTPMVTVSPTPIPTPLPTYPPYNHTGPNLLEGYTWRRLCVGSHDCGPSAPLPRSRHSATSIEDSMFVFAGEADALDPSVLLDDLWHYSVTQHRWTPLGADVVGPRPPPRRHSTLSAMEIPNPDPTLSVYKLYVYGGGRGERNDSLDVDPADHLADFWSIQVYVDKRTGDVRTDFSWKLICSADSATPCAPQERYLSSTVVSGGELYLYGSGYPNRNDLWRYSDGFGWQEVCPDSIPFTNGSRCCLPEYEHRCPRPFGTYGSLMPVSNGFVMVEKQSGSPFKFNTASERWEPACASVFCLKRGTPNDRDAPRVAAFGDDDVLISIGGVQADGTGINDVWRFELNSSHLYRSSWCVDGICGIPWTSIRPPVRAFPTLVSLSQPSAALLFFGGEAHGQVFGDLWILDEGGPLPSPTPAALFDDYVTPNVIFGPEGVENGNFTVRRVGGVEVGLRARLRYDDVGVAANTFNSDGTGTYTFSTGTPPIEFVADPSAIGRTPVWNVELSVNIDFDGTNAGLTIDDFEYELRLDGDPSARPDYGDEEAQWDFLNLDAEADSIPPLYFGDNITQPNGGALVTTARDYNRFRWNSTVAQQSWSYADFSGGLGPFPHLANFDPHAPGAYTVQLLALKEGEVVAHTTITVEVVGTPASAPTPVPIPTYPPAGHIRIDSCPSSRSEHPPNGTCVSSGEATASVACCRRWREHGRSGVECVTRYESEPTLLSHSDSGGRSHGSGGRSSGGRSHGPGGRSSRGPSSAGRSRRPAAGVNLESISYWYGDASHSSPEMPKCFPEAATHAEAADFCDGLVVYGLDDWGLCAVEEVEAGVCCDNGDVGLLGVGTHSRERLSGSSAEFGSPGSYEQPRRRTLKSLLGSKPRRNSLTEASVRRSASGHSPVLDEHLGYSDIAQSDLDSDSDSDSDEDSGSNPDSDSDSDSDPMPDDVVYVCQEPVEVWTSARCGGAPTPMPTRSPTPMPTHVPTPVPSPIPTASPSPMPTRVPTPVPSTMPTPVPSSMPTPVPTPVPTLSPTVDPIGHNQVEGCPNSWLWNGVNPHMRGKCRADGGGAAVACCRRDKRKGRKRKTQCATREGYRCFDRRASFEEAEQFCEDLRLDGEDDWRLCSSEEVLGRECCGGGWKWQCHKDDYVWTSDQCDLFPPTLPPAPLPTAAPTAAPTSWPTVPPAPLPTAAPTPWPTVPLPTPTPTPERPMQQCPEQCCFRFKSPRVPKFTFPEPLSQGDHQLNVGNPIVRADGSPIEHGCNTYSWETTQYLSDSGQWENSWVDASNREQQNIDIFYATNRDHFMVRTVQSYQAPLKDILSGRLLRTNLHCDNVHYGCVLWTLDSSNFDCDWDVPSSLSCNASYHGVA